MLTVSVCLFAYISDIEGGITISNCSTDLNPHINEAQKKCLVNWNNLYLPMIIF